MGCACNKQKSNGLAAKRAESPAPTPAAKAAPTTRTSGVAGTSARAPMSGRTQSFSLQAGDKTATFGSRLERDAAAIRSGARPI